MFCSNCGKELSESAKFCPLCGAKAGSGADPERSEAGLKLVPAVCTNCGAPLTLPPDSKNYICPHCNTEFLVDEAIRNYNISNMKGDVHIEHATVNVTGDPGRKNRRCCPECGSLDVAKLSMVYRSGVMDLKAHASNDSIFDNTGADIKGVYKSKLAQSIEPPEPWEYFATWRIVLFVFLGFPFVFSFYFYQELKTFIPFAVVMFLVFWSFKSVYTHNNTVYKEELENWNRNWCCKSCGFVFSDDDLDKDKDI